MIDAPKLAKGHTWWALALLVLFTGCAGSSPTGGGSSGATRNSGATSAPTSGTEQGGLWGQIQRDLVARAARRGESEVREAAVARGAADLAPGLKERIDRWWAAYTRRPWEVDSRLDPRRGGRPSADRLLQARKQIQADWLEARAAWEAEGEGPRNILAENLIRWYVVAFDASDGYEVERTRQELLRLKPVVIPYLVEGLASGTADDVVNKRIADLLAWFGPEVVPPLSDAFARAEPKRGRWALARALKQVRAPQVIPVFVRLAEDPDEDYRVRIEALEGLGKLADPETLPTFLRCLDDRDSSVRKFAASWCAALKRKDQVLLEALVKTLERDFGQNEGVAREVVQALQYLTGERIGMNLGAWKRVVAERGR